MIIADEVGTTFTLGPYTVRIALRPDNPAFCRFLVFKGDRLVGKQFSRPCETDCQWLERQRGEYANASRCLEMSLLAGIADASMLEAARHRGGAVTRKRGRPRKDDTLRQLQEALSA